MARSKPPPKPPPQKKPSGCTCPYCPHPYPATSPLTGPGYHCGVAANGCTP